MNIANKFDLSNIVYLKTDPEQYKRIITAIVLHQGSIMYELSVGEETSYHYDFEISSEIDIMMTSNN
jgi:hypothetical protein